MAHVDDRGAGVQSLIAVTPIPGVLLVEGESTSSHDTFADILVEGGATVGESGVNK